MSLMENKKKYCSGHECRLKKVAYIITACSLLLCFLLAFTACKDSTTAEGDTKPEQTTKPEPTTIMSEDGTAYELVTEKTELGKTITLSTYPDGDKLRAAVFEKVIDEKGNTDDDKVRVRMTDYSDGTFLMYNTTLPKSEAYGLDINTLLVIGYDGKTVTESDAETAVRKIVGSKNTGVLVDCEGIVIKKDEKESAMYYLMRVDKENLSSAYYYVDVRNGAVTLKEASSELI